MQFNFSADLLNRDREERNLIHTFFLFRSTNYHKDLMYRETKESVK